MKKLKSNEMGAVNGGGWSWAGCAGGALITGMRTLPYAAVLGGAVGVGVVMGIGCVMGGYR